MPADDDKIAIVKSKHPEHEGVLVGSMRFLHAYDFPGAQETHIKCSTEVTNSGRCFTSSYHPSLNSFEVRIYMGGALVDTMWIPREQVKQYTRV